jgi:cyclic beta-1,2-glucan synthetase
VLATSLNFVKRSKPAINPFSECEEPIRFELFSVERLEEHAESLAHAQTVTETPRKGFKLAPRAHDNGRVLLQAYQAIIETVRKQRAITPAAEWLIDNFHIIEEQLRDIHDHLPLEFYRELPKLADGHLSGYPRVYGLAWAFVAHTDSRFDPDLLIRFVRAYQRVQVLTIGELWAVAITLRSVMVENLRRLSVRIVGSQIAREQADILADELLGLGGQSPQEAEASLRTRDEQPLRPAFAVQLVQRLRSHDPALTPALQWLNERLAAQDTHADEIVAHEHAKMVAANLTVRNIITSMRLMSAFDWQDFFEEVSLVDEALRADPGFSAMDFITRDRYRHAIEELAHGSRCSELEIAHAVIAKTQALQQHQSVSEPIEARLLDPGYYLISHGRPAFEKETGFRVSWVNRLVRMYFTHPAGPYIGTIMLGSLALLALPLWVSVQAGLDPPALLLLALLGFIPASDIAIALFNRLITHAIGPRHLPRLELAGGVPASLRSFVVVPTLLISEAQIKEQLEQIEVYYLSNTEGDLRFGLLSDWTDASAESVPGDAELFNSAASGVATLNARHGILADGTERFFLFHRKRSWNAGEQVWMGWERKRGKLEEFNRLLRGAADTSFITLDGQPPGTPGGVRYVVTLDADTKLPIGAVRQLVGTLAHPLNRPRFDPEQQRVVEGYGVLQPRITPTLPARRDSTIFQRLFSGPGGIDPYASAVSDVYQDLFGEGTYTGKGIYEVDVFEAALAGRVPENALLSHDLFEGTYARCGFVNDLEFFEDFPSHIEVAASRSHRWARGDWQLLPWICGKIGKGLGAIARWKMLDNLRRTLSAPAIVFTLLASWTLPFAPHWAWLTLAVAAIAVPALLPFVSGLLAPPRRDVSLRRHLRALADDFLQACGHIAVSIIMLAHQAWLMLDAIVRALTRLLVTRRKLLEWITAAQAKSNASLSLMSFLRRMSGAIVIALTTMLLVFFVDPDELDMAAPFIILWLFSPVFAWTISLPPARGPVKPLSTSETLLLRLSARRIWRFFTTFVGAKDNYLPPDNFQEDPQPVIAHRSSPTNFGLYLLAIISARDFGWIGLIETVERLEATLKTLQALPRLNGHYYNWYDTRELRALEPKYISSVDSGNLAGHLLALGQACIELVERPLDFSMTGIHDDVTLLREAVNDLQDNRRTLTVSLTQLKDAITTIEQLLEDVASDTVAQTRRWKLLETAAGTLADIARAFAGERGESSANSEILIWALLLHAGIKSHTRDAQGLLPWVECLARPHDRADLPTEENYHWDSIAEQLSNPVALAELPALCEKLIEQLGIHQASSVTTHTTSVAYTQDTAALIDALHSSVRAGTELTDRLHAISRMSRTLFDEMEFGFLFDPVRKLFSIGYRVTDNCLDASYYDLLASEARLTSFIAIAKGDVPAAHWFRLGRTMIPVDKGAALVSWSGSMFEYLMPSLVMYTPRGSLIGQTCRLIIQRQIDYGQEHKVPWGISESAYNARDFEFTYQYSNFGIPGLGLKRGLGQELVIAPYATALAAMYEPAAAVKNFRRIEAAGGRGRYGFYEALDFTVARLPEDTELVVVRAYMAHHQGMALVALVNILQRGAMRRRFHSEPLVQAAELLLQERTPRELAFTEPRADQTETGIVKEAVQPVIRRYTTPHLTLPATQLLSNGRYAVMVTSSGSGYSRWRDLAITRWRADAIRDSYGSFLFLRDTRSGKVWSATYQPTAVEPDRYEVVFSEDRARITRQDGYITSVLEIILSSEDDAEIRRLSLTNNGPRRREIEITSYAEMVLAPAAADLAHPAFSNLFVETEYLAEFSALLVTRRPRAATEARLWAAHVMALEGQARTAVEFETDRARFLGRGHDIHAPVAVMDGRPLSNTTGAVLDPIASLRVRVRIEPGTTAHVSFTTLAAVTREEIVDLADKYQNPTAFERTSTLAWTQAQVQLHFLSIERDEAQVFQNLASRILYSDPSLRPASEILKRNTLSIAGLWPHRISGDHPIILVRIDDLDDRALIRQLLRAHEYWGIKRLVVDLVILNEKASSYAQDLQIFLEDMVRASQADAGHNFHDMHGRVFVLRADLLTQQERELLQTVARAIISARQGSLSAQVTRMRRYEIAAPKPERASPPLRSAETLLAPPALEFFNGLGGFAAEGREYVIVLSQSQRTPAPWINVIANPEFGFQVSESGSGYTWSLNSRENQLTPWSNDPVSDPSGEVFYIADLDSGEFWSPTALPIRIETATYIARHGQGYSRFEHLSHGIYSDLLQFVSWDDPIKISRLHLHNRSKQVRRLSVTAYVEWVLGFTRATTAPFIITEMDQESGALFACNPLHIEFGKRIGFAAWSSGTTSWSADRSEFIGRHRSLTQPAALLSGMALSRTTGAGLDPCSALQSRIELAPGEHIELVFLLGQAQDRDAARVLLKRHGAGDIPAAFAKVTENWDDILGQVQVHTPDRAMDLMLNRWLLYQTLACRFWARAAFYQAGGAYGFRDQLQDAMALAVARPALARAHILHAAAHQFIEGDVQHWWHPPTGRGVRTHFSDDRIWLPYVVAHYLAVTQDLGILDEQIPFLEGQVLAPDQEDAYFEPTVSGQTASLFEHCARALECSLKVGTHGLPLMGTGDWNDGMNRVGHGGKGESVWLGWFLHISLTQFAAVASQRGEQALATQWLRFIDALEPALEAAWDGAWYRRAYFDDGTPLGSASSLECSIDSIAQTWGVLSGAAPVERAQQAMQSVEEHLIYAQDELVLLFTPPFDKTTLDPGYIKGYLPGVRENGGQYTHAAVWCVMAYATLGDGAKAADLFALLNPVNHAATRAGVHTYKVEPYVLAADIYAVAPHIGRGGWTWYTGSAGWMYRAGIEAILGLRKRGHNLEINPCIPPAWRGLTINYRHGTSRYEIMIENPQAVSCGIAHFELDGAPLNVAHMQLPLLDDGNTHHVRVVLGPLN